MTYLAVSLTLVCLALLWQLREERLQRDWNERRHQAEREGMLERFSKTEQTLLDRIQRPEVVMPASAPEGPPEKGFVDFESDEDYHRFMEELNVDDR